MKLTIRELKNLILVEGNYEDELAAEEAARAARWKAEEERPEVKPFLDALRNAQDPKELAKAKRALLKADDAGNPSIITGLWMSIYEKRKKELQDRHDDQRRLNNPNKAADARTDRLLRIRDSSGRAKARKF